MQEHNTARILFYHKQIYGLMKEKINVDKLVKELSKGDVSEQVAVLKFLKEQVALKLQAKQEELAALNQSL